jgi:hypothetical protein
MIGICSSFMHFHFRVMQQRLASAVVGEQCAKVLTPATCGVTEAFSNVSCEFSEIVGEVEFEWMKLCGGCMEGDLYLCAGIQGDCGTWSDHHHRLVGNTKALATF